MQLALASRDYRVPQAFGPASLQVDRLVIPMNNSRTLGSESNSLALLIIIALDCVPGIESMVTYLDVLSAKELCDGRGEALLVHRE